MDNKYYEELKAYFKKNIENLRQFRYTKFKDNITHAPIISYGSYSPWFDDFAFLAAYEKIKNNTLVDIYRCYELWQFALQANSLEGDFLEIGVWRGGTAGILGSAALKGNCRGKLFLCDTFKGVIKASDKDTLYKGGEHANTTQKTVENLLVELGVNEYEILTGIFPDDFKRTFEDKKIKLLHIDVDTYNSASESFHYSWPKMVKGGIVIFDDYGFWGCEGVTVFLNELQLNDGIKIYNINGHGIVLKK